MKTLEDDYMKAATVQEIKKELSFLETEKIQDLCLRLVKYKKENKELLTYLLFEAHDEQGYIDGIKQELEQEFQTISNLNVYYVKKSLRRILRFVNKQIKYSGVPKTEVELRIHFCQQTREAGVPISKSQVLINLYQQQINKINQAMIKLPEDLQYDYQNEIENLSL
ncbi:MAG: hypothetical protein JNM57_06660 [Cyclobacteriaceae bacterium]|nr:hypothetical protein [Cyclobacteriaceae bacterium]